MNLLDYYPKFDTFLKQEARTLGYLKDNTYLNDKQNDFAVDAATHHRLLLSNRPSLDFHSKLDLSHDGRMLLVVLSALVTRTGTSDYNNISYCVTVCRARAKGPAILRKFHFDAAIAPNGGHRNQSHPLFHVQYCGEFIPHLTKYGCTEQQLEKLHPWLSEPRVFYWPMSLALLIDMVLREFPRDGTKLANASEWRNIVRENEKSLLAPFHLKCWKIADNKGGENRLIADEFYVK